MSWCSRKQTTVAKSTTEAEYVSLSIATQEAIWLRRLMTDLGNRMSLPTIINEDNQGAIQLSRNPKIHNRTKHIDVSYHFVRERVTSNEIVVEYCPTQDMVADVMTKGLPRVTFQKFRNLLGVQKVEKLAYIHTILWSLNFASNIIIKWECWNYADAMF